MDADDLRPNCDGKPTVNHFDDIILLEPTPDLIETLSPHLADFGVCALVGEHPGAARERGCRPSPLQPLGFRRCQQSRPICRVQAADGARRSKPGGRAWFVGAGGPMGRMHLQRAIQIPEHPASIVCTDVSDLRLKDLFESYHAEAEAQGVELICLNPTRAASFAADMAGFRTEGFDDIVVLAPVAPLIADSAHWLAPNGVMNVFAGVARGTMASLDLGEAYLAGKRIIGHSASSIEDLKLMLHFAETGTLSPNRSVAAVGSLEAAKVGLQSVMDTVYPGKVVIYPHIKPLPLTACARS